MDTPRPEMQPRGAASDNGEMCWRSRLLNSASGYCTPQPERMWWGIIYYIVRRSAPRMLFVLFWKTSTLEPAQTTSGSTSRQPQARTMDASLPFRIPSGSASQSTPSGSVDSPWQHLLGEFIAFGIVSGTKRSVMGHSSRMRELAEGTVFRVFKTSIREYHTDSTFSATPVALKMLRGCPMEEDPLTYPHKDSFRTKQLTALVREMKVLGLAAAEAEEHIVRLHQWGFSTIGRPDEDEDDPQWVLAQPYLVLEFADCGTLRQFSRTADCVDMARDLALDIVSGLEFLHGHGIAHGDVKLENVLVFTHPNRRFSAKISDFSHSIFEEDELLYLGTPRCRPPEVTGERGLDLTFDGILGCDIWALGVAMFELLAGEEVGLDFTLGSSDETWPLNLMVCAREDMLASGSGLWSRALSLALCIDAQKRGSVAEIRELLDVQDRCRNRSGPTLRRLAPPTILEVWSSMDVVELG